MSEETLRDELHHAVNLSFKQRGELAELTFMRKAATLRFAVAKPWGDSDRYDVVVRTGKVFWRVQIKSVWGKALSRPHYRVQTWCKGRPQYTAEDIDFLVAYIFAEDVWYVFPVTVVQDHRIVCLWPGSKHSRFEQYRDAWKLMRPAGPEPAGPESESRAATAP